MKRQDLSEMLMGKLEPSRFQETYETEMSDRLSLLAKRGASVPIRLIGDQYVFVGKDGFRRLLEAFASGGISKDMLGYVLDVLSLDPMIRFQDTSIKDVAMELADDDFTLIDIQSALRDL